MGILLIAPQKISSKWKRAFQKLYPDLAFEVYPEVKDPEKVDFALTWNHPSGILKEYPNLKVVASMGAGVDHIFRDPQLPEDITVTKIEDEQLAKDMSVFVLSIILNHMRNLSYYKMQKISREWKPQKYLRIEDVEVGIMGLGALGKAVGKTLIKNDFKVRGWANSPKNMDDIEVFHGKEQLPEFLSKSDVLVCLLPLTSETENILNKELFQQLPEDAFIINVARGRNLVVQDLLDEINNGHLCGAALDVFREEPLPSSHPFWKNSKVLITPHTASVSNPYNLVDQIVENYKRMKNGEPLKNTVDKERKY